MAQLITDLAGDNHVAANLIDLAAAYNDAGDTQTRALAALAASTAVGRQNQTRALTQFYELADTVAAWRELDDEPVRKGLDHDLYVADSELLWSLWAMLTDSTPCRTALHAPGTHTVDQLHATRPGWSDCGCQHATATVGAA